MSVKLALMAFALATVTLAACGGSDAGRAHGGASGVGAMATATSTTTPTPAPRRLVVSASSDGVRPTDTPTATPTATNTPEPTATRVPPAPTRKPPQAAAQAQSGTWPAAVEQWRGLVCSYAWNCEDALRRINCESGGNAYAVNPNSGACGLWQHLPCEAQGDPIASTALAWAKYQARGWQPWVCT